MLQAVARSVARPRATQLTRRTLHTSVVRCNNEFSIDVPWLPTEYRQPAFYSVQSSILYEDRAHLDEWRKYNHDPFSFLDAKARQQWCDANRDYAAVYQTPPGSRYGLHHAAYGYGRDRGPWQRGFQSFLWESVWDPYNMLGHLFGVARGVVFRRWLRHFFVFFFFCVWRYWRWYFLVEERRIQMKRYFLEGHPTAVRGINWEKKIVHNGA